MVADAMRMYKKVGPDVCELYSPPRIVAEAGMRTFGNIKLRPGWSLDLTQVDPDDGKPWDLRGKGKVQKLWALIKSGKSYCIICSPPCTMYRTLQNLNKKHWTKEQYQDRFDKARAHIRICMQVCRWQWKQKRVFVFEHPAEAKSWSLPEVEDMMNEAGIYVAEFDMCRFGMQARDDNGVLRPVRKSTRMITTSWEVARRLQLRCHNRTVEKRQGKATSGAKVDKHQHTMFMGGKAKMGQVYPQALCQAVCAGIAAQEKQGREAEGGRVAHHEP